VGPAAEAELTRLGVRTIGQLARMPRQSVVARLGASGAHLLELAHGRDERPVEPWDDPKSVGAEETFGRDTDDLARLRATLLRQADGVASELRDRGLRGRTVTLKLRFADFRTLTRRDTTEPPTADGGEIFRRAWTAFGRLPRPQPIRLIGVSVSGLVREEGRQLGLFERAGRAEQVGRLADELRARFGPDAARRASLLRPGRRR